MTLLRLFNEALKKIPSFSKKLEQDIIGKRWPTEKIQQAVHIIKQLQTDSLLEATDKYVLVSLLEIRLSPRECGINNETTFGEGNISQAKRYIKDLLNDINDISEDVQFSLSGYRYEPDECLFYIWWEF